MGGIENWVVIDWMIHPSHNSNQKRDCLLTQQRRYRLCEKRICPMSNANKNLTQQLENTNAFHIQRKANCLSIVVCGAVFNRTKNMKPVFGTYFVCLFRLHALATWCDRTAIKFKIGVPWVGLCGYAKTNNETIVMIVLCGRSENIK